MPNMIKYIDKFLILDNYLAQINLRNFGDHFLISLISSLYQRQIKMSIKTKSKSISIADLSEPHKWLEGTIKENHIRYFDYSHFKDFQHLGVGGFGKVEKAIYDFAGIEIPCALKTIFNLHDKIIEKTALTEFIKEVCICISRPCVVFVNSRYLIFMKNIHS